MADKTNCSTISSGEDTSERPQDWEMLALSLSSITESKSSTDVGVVPSSTGSSEEEPKGIPDDQVHSKYFVLASSSLSEKTKNKEDCMFKQEAGKIDTSIGHHGTEAAKYGLEGTGFVSDVDWMEPSPLLANPLDSVEVGATESFSTKAESCPGKNENEQQESIIFKATNVDLRPVGSSPIGEGTHSISELCSCLNNDDTECFTDVEKEAFVKPDYAFSEALGEVYGDPRAAADADSAGQPLMESPSTAKSKKIWWKQQMEVLGVHVNQASALWSLALAATVMGLVILGRRWCHERSQNQQLRLQLGSKDEKINQLIFQISRLKDAISGQRRVPVMRS